MARERPKRTRGQKLRHGKYLIAHSVLIGYAYFPHRMKAIRLGISLWCSDRRENFWSLSSIIMKFGQNFRFSWITFAIFNINRRNLARFHPLFICYRLVRCEIEFEQIFAFRSKSLGGSKIYIAHPVLITALLSSSQMKAIRLRIILFFSDSRNCFWLLSYKILKFSNNYRISWITNAIFIVFRSEIFILPLWFSYIVD